jgi:hypothetical protein
VDKLWESGTVNYLYMQMVINDLKLCFLKHP